MKLGHRMLCATAIALPFSVSAQQQPADNQVIEEVFVTGSLIRRSSFDGPSAVQQVTAEDIQVEGASNIIDVVRNLSINTGSHLARFAPEFGGSSGGTSQFNLRGLGLNATLTLVDGRRLAPSPSSGMGGAQFVNINQIPASMIERIDILKTGASATYGSEAVAGVVNIITKKNFEGLEFSMDYRDSDTVPWSESSFSLIGGATSDRARATVGLELQDRSLLKTMDLPANVSEPLVFRTTFGQPGAFQVGSRTYTDPLCGQPGQAGVGQSIAPSSFPYGRCSASLKEFFTALPDDERVTGWGNVEFDFTDRVTGYAQIGYSLQDTWVQGPTSTVASQFRAIIPANHPDWPTELTTLINADNPGGWSSAQLIGRHILNNADQFTQLGGASMADGGISQIQYRNLSSVFGVNGDFDTDGGRNWAWDMSWTGSYNNAVSRGRSTSKSRWQAAINNCLPETDPNWQDAVGCWNPFSNAYQPGYTGNTNTQTVYDYISPFDSTYTTTSLESINGSITGGLMDMSGGELSVAFGFQIRREEYTNDPESQQNNGDNVNQNSTEPDEFRHRSVDAYFAELAIPFERVEIQLAVRKEDYGRQGGSSTDPKVAFQWDVTDNFMLRGSWSTAFRAPSLNQFGTSTQSRTLTPPWNFEARGLYAVTVNTETLKPEESEASTIGFVWDPTDSINFGMDFWNYDYTDLIAIQDPAGLLSQVCAPGFTTSAESCDPNAPGYNQIVFDSIGELQTMTVLGINAAAVQLSGVDMFGSWSPNVSWADSYTMRLDSSYFSTYDIQEFVGGPTIDAVGYANLENIAPSVPQLRWNLMNMFTWGNHSANVAIRFVDSLEDRVVGSDAPNLASRTTVDAQYNYYFDGWGAGGTISVGAINILDEPLVYSDNETGIVGDRDDPRGRTLYVTYKQAF